MAGRPAAHVARAVGIAPQTLDGYLRGAIPGADRAVALADELKVDVRWLVTGEDPRAGRAGAGGDDWVILPRYDLYDFSGPEKPAPVEEVAVRRDWLAGVARATTGLWLTDMPSNAMPEIGREGDSLVCQDVTPPLVEGRAYAVLLDGRPVIRRISMRPEGLVLKAGDPAIDPITLTGEDVEALTPLGRVLGAISLKVV